MRDGGDPDGDRGEHGPGGERERLAERLDHVSGHRLDRGGVRGVADEQRELIAAEPRGGVAVPRERYLTVLGGSAERLALPREPRPAGGSSRRS